MLWLGMGCGGSPTCNAPTKAKVETCQCYFYCSWSRCPACWGHLGIFGRHCLSLFGQLCSGSMGQSGVWRRLSASRMPDRLREAVKRMNLGLETETPSKAALKFNLMCHHLERFLLVLVVQVLVWALDRFDHSRGKMTWSPFAIKP